MLSKIIRKLQKYISPPPHPVNTKLKCGIDQKAGAEYISGDAFNQSKTKNHTGSGSTFNQRFTP